MPKFKKSNLYTVQYTDPNNMRKHRTMITAGSTEHAVTQLLGTLLLSGAAFSDIRVTKVK